MKEKEKLSGRISVLLLSFPRQYGTEKSFRISFETHLAGGQERFRTEENVLGRKRTLPVK